LMHVNFSSNSASADFDPEYFRLFEN